MGENRMEHDDEGMCATEELINEKEILMWYFQNLLFKDGREEWRLWSDGRRQTKQSWELYEKIDKISTTINKRRMTFCDTSEEWNQKG